MNRRIAFSNKMIIVIFTVLLLFSYGLDTKNTASPSNHCQITRELGLCVMMNKVNWINMRPAPSS